MPHRQHDACGGGDAGLQELSSGCTLRSAHGTLLEISAVRSTHGGRMSRPWTTADRIGSGSSTASAGESKRSAGARKAFGFQDCRTQLDLVGIRPAEVDLL